MRNRPLPGRLHLNLKLPRCLTRLIQVPDPRSTQMRLSQKLFWYPNFTVLGLVKMGIHQIQIPEIRKYMRNFAMLGMVPESDQRLAADPPNRLLAARGTRLGRAKSLARRARFVKHRCPLWVWLEIPRVSMTLKTWVHDPFFLGTDPIFKGSWRLQVDGFTDSNCFCSVNPRRFNLQSCTEPRSGWKLTSDVTCVHTFFSLLLQNPSSTHRANRRPARELPRDLVL